MCPDNDDVTSQAQSVKNSSAWRGVSYTLLQIEDRHLGCIRNNQSINALLYSWPERNWVHSENIKHDKNVNKYIAKTKLKSSINVCEQVPCNEVMFVSFCGQDKVMPSRSETVAVTVEVWKELLQDMMLVVHDSLEQTFVGVFNELSSSGVTVSIQAEPNTSTDHCFDALFVGSGSELPRRSEA